MLVFVGRSRDGDAFDETRIREKTAEASRDSKRPASERARDDVRDFVTENRMRIGCNLQVNFVAPRFGDVRVRRAHEAFFFLGVFEEERGDARGALRAERFFDLANFFVAIFHEERGVLVRHRRRVTTASQRAP